VTLTRSFILDDYLYLISPPSSTLVNTYAIASGLWPIFVPCLIEQSLIMSLTVMKYFYDKEDERNSLILKEGPAQHSMSTTIQASEMDVTDVEAANESVNTNSNK
jgi:hypothetical protein